METKVNTHHHKSLEGLEHEETDRLEALEHCEPWDETAQHEQALIYI